MYEKPKLKRYGSFRELTRDGGICSILESDYPDIYKWLTGQGYCLDDTPDGGGIS